MLQKIIVLVFGVLTFMMLARELLPSFLGVWGLFLIASGIIETARNALIRNAYIVFKNQSTDEDQPGIEYASLVTNLIFSLFIVIILLSGGKYIEKVLNAPGLAQIFYIYCISLVFLLPFSRMEISLMAKSDFKGILIMYLFRNGFLLLAVTRYYLDSVRITIVQLSILNCIAIVLGCISGYIYLKKFEKPKLKFSRSILYRYLHYGKYVLGNNLSSLIFRNTDSFLASAIISAVASAYYSTSTRISNFSDMPSQVLGDIMFPKASKILKDGKGEAIKELYEKTVAATMTFTLPVIILVLIFSRQIIFIMAGKQYFDAIPLLRLVILYGLFLPFIRQFGNIMDVTSKPHINFLTMFVFALINIILNILGLKYIGLLGSAYATLFSYFLLFLVAMFILKRYHGVQFSQIVKNIGTLYPEYWKILMTYKSK